MPMRSSFQEYPRRDTVYRTKPSLDFDMMRTRIYLKREGRAQEEIIVWIMHIIVGIMTGTLCFCLTFCEDKMTVWRATNMQKLINEYDNELVASYFFYAGVAVAFVLFASSLTVYFGPGAMGSGVPEVMGMLNGINYPGAIGFATLITKVLGILFAVVGGLAIGKEGPLVHIGANVGVMCMYMPFAWCSFIHNDWHKRQFIAAGGAAGVAVAFGAPIGGALFAFEISRPNTFWHFQLLWRVFLTTSVACFTLALLQAMQTGAPLNLTDSGAIKFGIVAGSYENLPLDIVAAIIIGIICGLLGAGFINFTIWSGAQRKKYLTTNRRRVMEAVGLAFVTASCFYLAVMLYPNNCKDKIGTLGKDLEEEIRF